MLIYHFCELKSTFRSILNCSSCDCDNIGMVYKHMIDVVMHIPCTFWNDSNSELCDRGGGEGEEIVREMKGLSAPKTTLSPFNDKYLTARHIKIKWMLDCLSLFFASLPLIGDVVSNKNNTHTCTRKSETTTNMANKCSLFNDHR